MGLTSHSYDFIACYYASTLGRTVSNDILHMDSILSNDEFDADTTEWTLEIIGSLLRLFRWDIDRVRVQFGQYLRDSFLHQVIDIDGIDILIIDDMQEIIESVATRIDDIETISWEMIGIERPYHYTFFSYVRWAISSIHLDKLSALR